MAFKSKIVFEKPIQEKLKLALKIIKPDKDFDDLDPFLYSEKLSFSEYLKSKEIEFTKFSTGVILTTRLYVINCGDSCLIFERRDPFVRSSLSAGKLSYEKTLGLLSMLRPKIELGEI